MKTASPQSTAGTGADLKSSVFHAVFGAYLGLLLLKFGNPPIMEKFVERPSDIYQFLLGYPWPIAWAYGLLILVLILGLSAGTWRTYPRSQWLLVLPVAWLAWQILSASQTLDSQLSTATVKHMAACVACFYLGYFGLNRNLGLSWFWPGLFLGLIVVLAVGWEQHFGGLEETRRWFFAYVYPELKVVSPEYLKKISSDRIFSTLFYPNALAGALLLFSPLELTVIWTRGRLRFTVPALCLLTAILAIAAGGCLFWSGSKGGWLLMMLLGVVTLLRLRLPRYLRIMIICAVMAAGVAGFFVRYSGFFKKGATSVSARFDYWQAALQTAGEKPILGTGPGTFAIPYQRLKRPESEMARLVHNDYLQQASDSGVPGFLLYGVLIGGGLALGYPRRKQENPSRPPDTERELLALWLGVLAWALQGFIEFGLYIPALAWPAFAFLGFLVKSQRASTA